MRYWLKSLNFFKLRLGFLYYKSPSNQTYWWNFGSLALYFLMIQILTGVFLAMYYDPSLLYAYGSIMYINNEIYYGWLIRSLHANGASFFFLCVYIHMFRGLYYGSFFYPRQLLWSTGIILFFLMIITAFLGYILPWGQMSFRAAMVITSLIAAMPLIGTDVVFLLWGSFSIEDVTLHRFYALHFLIPFIILFLSIIHISILHEAGSSNPLGIPLIYEVLPFSPYYMLKDFLSILIIIFVILFINIQFPDILGHNINYQIANFLVTPSHIVPEWYLLFFYAILRSIPNKVIGLFAFLLSIIVLLMIPYIMKNSIIRSSLFRPLHKIFFWWFLIVCILLGWIGGIPVIEPYLFLGRLLSILYFSFLLLLFPLSVYFEKLIYIFYLKKYYNV